MTVARQLNRRSKLWALVLTSAATATTLVACGAMPTKSSLKATQAPTGDSGLATYLETMQHLANGEPTQQADVIYDVERAYTSAPTTANSLRRAVALVTPGHPASNLAEGKKLLEQLLATPERLSPSERNLAAFLVKDADTRLQLQAEIRRLTATVDEHTIKQANSERRVQLLLEEIAKLKRALDEVQHKLDATISIERSNLERSPPSAPGR